ncbi:MAG: hypothetical protein RBS37_07485 [Bacteroidales bacterium]|jgi:glutathione synthase/RimK-type ligase-like ATP-grasp enzyme|nr:hypothetical protein [Bacteroidales bacterium]
MSDTIYALTDYKGLFGSKHFASPYRSGMDRDSLTTAFRDRGYDIEYLPLADAAALPSPEWLGRMVLYTGSEDPGYHYKSFIEDVVLHVEQCGAMVIPSYRHLRANNNKVFMELLRRDLGTATGMSSHVFGSADELEARATAFTWPVVIKRAAGAMGRGVVMADTEKELVRQARKLSSTGNIRLRIKEYIRTLRHKGYLPDSMYRGKLIVQPFVPGLVNDWKVYVMGSRIFVFYRPVFGNRTFRASGGGYDNYRYGTEADVPPGLFNFAAAIFAELDVPMASLDIGYDSNGGQFILFEFQSVFFGTAGMLRHYSSHYFVREGSEWVTQPNDLTIEEYYAGAVDEYIRSRR